ncbi:exported hypothetical protein [Candidatus Zixiibacteriota bacterium]|nr:exported hypothetical protein [candidate division Zixibacteria bacterium]
MKPVQKINRQVLIAVICTLILISCSINNSQAQSLVWSSNLGGAYNEVAYSGLQAADGDFIVLGSTFSFGSGDFDIYLLKLNSAGDTVWAKTFGGPLTEYGNDIKATHDGGYIITGSTKSYGAGKKDVYLQKIDSLGNSLWAKTYGGVEDDEGWSVQATSDGGYIICGTTNSFGAGYSDLYLIKTNGSGDTSWTRTFGGSGGESGAGVAEIPNDGYLAIGSTGSFGEGYSSIYAVRVGASGDSLWSAIYGGTKADFGRALAPTLDNGFVIAGSTNSYGAGYSDAYLIKINAAGMVAWEQTYGSTRDDIAYSVCAARDGGYMLAGTTESFGAAMIDAYVIKTDPAGNLIWNHNYGGSKSDYGRMIIQTQSRDYMLFGYSYSFSSSGSDVYVAKIKGDATPVPESSENNLPSGFALYQNWPNPFNLSTTIQFSLPRRSPVALTIYNILGQTVRRWTFPSLPPGTHSVSWDGRTSTGIESGSGIYLYQIRTPEYGSSRKMVLVK